MGALTAAASWEAEDDVLLKNAVEAGASLESLAKGAVCFSRKFTFQELQDHWCSLLYDSKASAQASARIVKYETELSTSNPAKAQKLFYSRQKDFSLGKRTIESVKHQYYAMRKRVCHEPSLAADFGYVVSPCSCRGGCVCGGLLNPLAGHHLVHKDDPTASFVNSCGHVGESCAEHGQYLNDNRHHIFHKGHDNAAGSMVIDGNTNDEILHGCPDVVKLYGCDDMQKNPQSSESSISFPKDLSDLQYYVQLPQQVNEMTGSEALLGTDHDGIKQGQFSGNNNGGLQEPGSLKAISKSLCSQAPRSPTCSKFQGVDSPDMLSDMHHNEQEILTFFDDKKKETAIIDSLALEVNMDDGMSGSGVDNATEGNFMHSHLMNVSQSEDSEIINGEITLDSALDPSNEDLGKPNTKHILKDITRVHHPDLRHVTNTCGNHTDPIAKHSMTDISGTDMVRASPEAPCPGGHIECMLNTEDPEIPCNDDVFITVPLESTSNCDQNSEHNVHLVSTNPPQNANDYSHTDMVRDVQPLSLPMKLEPSNFEQKEPLLSLNESCTVIRKPPGMHGYIGANNANPRTSTFHSATEFVETACGLVQHESFGNFENLTLDNKSTGAPGQMNFNFLAGKPEISCETSIQNGMSSNALADTEFHCPVTTMSTSDQAEGGSDSEISVPDYFDIEALILDQDLIPWDQGSNVIHPEVSRFQYLESRKDLIRLEQGACSYLNRSIMFQGAFAILYGQRLKYYIKDPEVTLGRETEEVHVDIDLGKEGKANKISRRQAVIKMDEGGSFHIKNIGKCPIFVNSKEVPCNKRINLISDALLQIRDMRFIFHVNQAAVRQYIVRAWRGSSQGQNTTFDWNQNP